MGEHLESALAFLGKESLARKPGTKRAAGSGRPSRKTKAASGIGHFDPTLPKLGSRAVDRLAEKLQVPELVVLDVSQISARTFHRRQSEGQPLTAEEADRILRIARVASETERVFGDAEKARVWLTTSSAILGGPPLRLLATDAGTREVEAELGRIDWGDFA